MQGVLSGNVRCGIPKSGKRSDKRILMVTRVVVGSEVVSNRAESDLVQFGPAFLSCGPTERVATPAAVRPILLSRPTSPVTPSRTTIDGSSLKDRPLLVASRRGREDGAADWPQRKISHSSPDDQISRQDRGRRKRGRPKTNDRVLLSAGGPEPWTSNTDAANRQFSASSRTELFNPEVSASRKGDEVVVENGRIARDQANQRRRGHSSSPSEGLEADISACGGGQQSRSPTPPPTVQLEPGDTDQQGSQDTWTNSKLTRQVDSREGEGSSAGGELAEETLASDGSCTHEGQGVVGGDNFSMLSQCGVESACPRISVASLSTACALSVSECSTEPVSKRRSFSSLDTERYGGTLSNNANEIVRSHIEAPLSHASRDSRDGIDSQDQDKHDQQAADIAGALSPVCPPSPPLKVIGLGEC